SYKHLLTNGRSEGFHCQDRFFHKASLKSQMNIQIKFNQLKTCSTYCPGTWLQFVQNADDEEFTIHGL
ncbi:MAG: hypothetical protein ACLFN9_17205, partial [Desulfococcaceae bacterium]